MWEEESGEEGRAVKEGRGSREGKTNHEGVTKAWNTVQRDVSQGGERGGRGSEGGID